MVATPPSLFSNLGGIRQDYDKLIIEEAIFSTKWMIIWLLYGSEQAAETAGTLLDQEQATVPDLGLHQILPSP